MEKALKKLLAVMYKTATGFCGEVSYQDEKGETRVDYARPKNEADFLHYVGCRLGNLPIGGEVTITLRHKADPNEVKVKAENVGKFSE